jgi:acyl-CoA synthetase (AMP-forming)/AMP-acid ligase II
MHDSANTVKISETLKPKTVLDAFLQNISDAPVNLLAGLHGEAQMISRQEIYGRGCALARKFQSLGVEQGDKVMTILPTGKPFLVSVFGAWLAGAAIVPIAPPAPGSDLDYYEKKLASMIQTAQPKVIVACDAVFGALKNLSELIVNIRVLPDTEVLFDFAGEPHAPHIPHPNDIAHVQFTSGSTSFPKGAMISHSNICANVTSIAKVVFRGNASDEKFASWLPIYHDMGITALTFSFYHGIELDLIPTETFIRNPAIWLKTISDARATLSPAPTFAYDLLGSRVSDARLKGIDLSSWRYAWVGAEPIFPKTLRKFNERFSEYGLSETTLKPCYGLAEATLAVSLTPLADSYKVAWVNQKLLRETGFAESITGAAENAVPITSCGTAISETEVKITNTAGAEVEERRQGRVLVRGASVMEGYLGDAKTPIDQNGWLDTGDLGFVIGEDIYITGRAKDLIIRGGVNIHPQEIEKVADQIPDVRMGTAAAFSCVRHDTAKEEIILVVETRQKDESARQRIIEDIRRAVIGTANVQLDRIELAAPGTVPKTTSGKIQRGMCRENYLKQVGEK